MGERFGHFRVEGELGRGRTTRVLRAWDEEAGRPVALKVLVAAGDAARARFERERRALATLGHPAIPPLYDAGSGPAGEPWLAMPIVDGRPLVDVAGVGGGRAALPHAIAVCEALAHAHARGVVHGRLDATRVLVGTFGETVVRGWGAAEDGDARGDVRDLGALLERVLAGERTAMAPELATVVARARGPEATGAAEVARDLARYATGQLVAGHRYSAAALLGRFLARRRVAVAALAALAVTGLLAGGVGLAGVARERRRAEAQAVLAEDARRLAAARRDAAEGLTGEIVVELERHLGAVGRLDLLADTAQAVERYYLALAGTAHARAPSALGHLATAIDVLGEVTQARGDIGSALALIAIALDLRGRALALDPDDVGARIALARSYGSLAAVRVDRDELDGAVVAARRSLALAGEAAAREPGGVRGARLVAEAQARLAHALAQHGDAEEELRAWVAARAVLARLLTEGHDEVLADLADAAANLGVVAMNVFDPEAQMEAMTTSLAIHEALRARAPRDAELEMAVSVDLQFIAGAAYSLGDLELAGPTYARCLALRRDLAARDPENGDVVRRVMSCAAGLADVEVERGHPEVALGMRRQNIVVARALLAAHPDNSIRRRDLALGLEGIAGVELAAGDARAALGHVDESLPLVEGLAADDPARVVWQEILADLRQLRGEIELALGHREAARAEARTALGIAEKVLAHGPGNADYQEQLADVRLAAGKIELAAGDREAARGLLAAAVELYLPLLQARGASAPLQVTVAEALLRLAAADPARGRELRARAAALLEALAARGRLAPKRAPLLAELQSPRVRR